MSDDPLDLVDLLIPFARARSAAVQAAATGSWLDASLLAAGCSQVVEDHIHRSEGLLDRVAVHLADDDPEPNRASRSFAGAAAAVRTGHRARPEVSRLLAPRDELLRVAVELSAAAGPGAQPSPELLGAVERVLGPGAAWPDVLDDRALRLPSSFRSFDQQPEDVRALVALAAERWPDRQRPVLVVGIRTSGSYLGPIAVAELRRLGYERAELITMRAEERLDRSQLAAVARVRGGTVLLTDDPPVSGSTVRDCIGPLLRAGVAAEAIALLLALPDGWRLAPFLDRYEQLTLPGSQWRITRLFEPEAIERAAGAMLAERGDRLVGGLVAAPDPVGPAPGGSPRTPREHRRAAYTATIERADGVTGPVTLLVQGVGVGLFGRHDAAVATRLGDLVPEVLGVADGLLFQLLDAPQPTDPPAVVGPEEAARYVLERHRRLPAAVDRSDAMRGRKAAWEVAGMLVGGALGRIDVGLRTALVHPVVRAALHVGAPSIIDGRMTADRFLATAEERVVKADFADGAFSNRDLWSYDAVADLAAIGDELGRPAEVLAAWDRAGGHPVDPSRWALLRLVAAWDRHRHGGLPQPAYGRTTSGVLVDHIGALYLADLGPATGPWCVTDVDGVLETTVASGASAPGRRGGEALRALVAHGYRTVPVTGRSAGEVAHRCRSWGLPAGIAEYGSALIVDGRVVDLREDGQRAATERARAWLQARDGVVVDPAHQHSVRAWRTDRRGHRGPLDAEDLAGLAAGVAEPLTLVPGEDQTDIVAAGISKEGAIVALLERLDPGALGPSRPLAFAAGDGPADIAMLGLAELSIAPSHARPEVRAAATTEVAGAYQQGLADGVERLIGHRPGGCPRCEVELAPVSSALVTALSVHEAGPRGMPARLARLAREARAAGRLGRRLRSR